jgi:hypothetical protein
MSIVYKGILRLSMVNIINFTKVGLDALPGEVVPLSARIQRLQRKILYSGVLTKNSKPPVGDTKKLVDYSEGCKAIITTLQVIKDDPRLNKDKCLIEQD